ncbi:MAG: ABC transporter substrate-binding protein [Xanthobacteraceae bacterium]
MRRRDFITLAGGAAAICSSAARAQQKATPVVGFLSIGSLRPFAHEVTAFRQGLSEIGYVEGDDVTIEYRWAEGHNERLPELAADLVGRQVSIIATLGNVAISAAKEQTTTIPIVFMTGGDPVRDSFVASLNRPNGNITGATWFSPDPMAKRIDLLHQIVPNAVVIAQFVDQSFSDSVLQIPEVKKAANALGLQLVVLGGRTSSDIDTEFASLLLQGANALAVGPGGLHFNQRAQIVALANRHAIPAIYPFREFADEGGLISYGNKLDDAFHWAGVYVGRILKGEKTADLPVIQSTKFELVINLKTARAQRTEFPATVLALADSVIE